MAAFSVHENELIQKAESMKKVADKSCRDSDLETAYFNYRAAAYTMLEVFKTCPSSLKDGTKESAQFAIGRMSTVKKQMAQNKISAKPQPDLNDMIPDQINNIIERTKIARAAGQSSSDPSILLYGARHKWVK